MSSPEHIWLTLLRLPKLGWAQSALWHELRAREAAAMPCRVFLTHSEQSAHPCYARRAASSRHDCTDEYHNSHKRLGPSCPRAYAFSEVALRNPRRTHAFNAQTHNPQPASTRAKLNPHPLCPTSAESVCLEACIITKRMRTYHFRYRADIFLAVIRVGDFRRIELPDALAQLRSNLCAR